MPKSTSSPTRRKATPRKPGKPYDGYPLFAHHNGQWAKKIRGKLYYFGLWKTPEGALRKYLEERDDLHAGRTPRVQGDGLTVAALANHFMTHKMQLRDGGELVPRTLAIPSS